MAVFSSFATLQRLLTFIESSPPISTFPRTTCGEYVAISYAQLFDFVTVGYLTIGDLKLGPRSYSTDVMLPNNWAGVSNQNTNRDRPFVFDAIPLQASAIGGRIL